METEVADAKSRMLKVDEWLDQYEGKLGLPTFNEQSVSTNLNKYLEMSHAELEVLQPAQCYEIATQLTQHSFNLQRAINKEKSHVTWCNESLKLGVAGKTANYKGSFQQQEMCAIKEDSYLESVFKMKMYAEQRVNRLEFLSSGLNKLAERLENIGRNKQKRD